MLADSVEKKYGASAMLTIYRTVAAKLTPKPSNREVAQGIFVDWKSKPSSNGVLYPSDFVPLIEAALKAKDQEVGI